MSKIQFIVLIVFQFAIQTAWALPKNAKVVTLVAGGHQLNFTKTPNIEWSDFCYEQKMGCARFQVKHPKKPSFGFIKVVTDKLEKTAFKNYCQEVFDLSKASDSSLKNFNQAADTALPHCSWFGVKDVTHLYWKDGITLMVTTSDKFDVQKIISEAKLNEKL